jgi:hypothetical protein
VCAFGAGYWCYTVPFEVHLGQFMPFWCLLGKVLYRALGVCVLGTNDAILRVFRCKVMYLHVFSVINKCYGLILGTRCLLSCLFDNE